MDATCCQGHPEDTKDGDRRGGRWWLEEVAVGMLVGHFLVEHSFCFWFTSEKPGFGVILTKSSWRVSGGGEAVDTSGVHGSRGPDAPVFGRFLGGGGWE